MFVALIPLVLGAVLEGLVEAVSGYLFAVGILWIINGIIFLVTEDVKKPEKHLDKITPLDALRVGCFQLFAILPGISRSGMTITGGRLHGFTREFAVKFSFILSIPAIVGSTAITLIKDWDKIQFGSSTGIILAGVGAAFVSGLAAIKLLQYISRKSGFKGFAYYCLAAGVFAIGFDIVRGLLF